MAALTVMVMMLVMLVFVMAAFTVVVMMLMMLVFVMAALTVVVMMLMMLVFVVAAFTVMVMMLVMFVRLLCESLKLRLKRRLALHRLKQLRTRKLIPRSSYDNSSIVVFLQKLHTLVYLLVGYTLRVAKYDASGILDLVVEKFTEILHVHLALLSINNGCKSIENSTLCVCTLNCLYNV